MKLQNTTIHKTISQGYRGRRRLMVTSLMMLMIALLSPFTLPFQANAAQGELATPPMNFEAMAQTIHNSLSGKTVGYGFAIYQNGVLKKEGAGGWARRAPDSNPLPFKATSRLDIASSSKTITALTVLKALEIKKLTPDALIYKYLPATWNIHPSVKKLTFRQVLTHTSGLKKVTDGTDAGVQATVKQGVTGQPADNDYAYDYENINFCLLRVTVRHILNPLLPNVLFPSGVKFLEAASELVFKPAGINQVRMAPAQGSNNPNDLTLFYNFEKTTAGIPGDVHIDDGGAGGFFISARELAQVMAALENGKILSLAMKQAMKSGELGIYQVDSSPYYTHNGGFGDGQGRGTSTRLVLCPNNVQVAIVINSANNSCESTFDIVKKAFEAGVPKP